jgi:hypothetical protein
VDEFDELPKDFAVWDDAVRAGIGFFRHSLWATHRNAEYDELSGAEWRG